MNNLDLYEAVRSVPKEALKPILGGKLKGKSDINPMWRIKALTEQFGPCGKGWKPELVKTWIDDGANGEKIVNVILNLYVKFKGEQEWSDPVLGIGGNTIVQLEKGQLVTNDEAYKMAYTDALSVACKALGFAADVYYEKDKTKYGELGNADTNTSADNSGFKSEDYKCAVCGKQIDKKLFDQTVKAYGTPLCSAECKAVLAKAGELNN